jgi:hypothetical protein
MKQQTKLCLLQMEATCSSETLADFQRTAQRYIPEDKTLQFSRVFES